MIRSAHLTDVSAAVELVAEFIEEYVAHSLVYTEHEGVLDRKANKIRLQNMVLDWIKNHYVIIAFDQEAQPQGIMAAVRESNYWDPDIKILREIAWYVRPTHRRSRLSAELFMRWSQDTDDLIKRKVVNRVCISMPHGHETVSLNKRGWQPLEQHWIKG